MSPDPALLARAVTTHAVVLPSVEHAGDEDLAVLDDVIGDARVVAVGESTHFVAELAAAQRRLVRYLAERHGFTVLALEFGAVEAETLDAWVHGRVDDLVLHPEVPGARAEATRDRWRWLREHHAAGGAPVAVVGVDTPCGGGSLRPVLDPVIAFLERADPESVPLARGALEVATRWESLSQAGSAPRWAALPPAERDRVTASLARLALRLDAIRPVLLARTGATETDRARRLLAVARTGDHMVGAIHALFSGEALTWDASVRDRMMADLLLSHLDRLGAAQRVVLVAHNLHIQRAPTEEVASSALVMGSYLADALGADYRAIALTHTAGRAPQIVMSDADPHGFVVAEEPVTASPPGGLEAALVDAGLGGAISVLPLAPLRADPRTRPDGIGAQGAPVPTDVAAAFDAVLSVPTATTTDRVTLY